MPSGQCDEHAPLSLVPISRVTMITSCSASRGSSGHTLLTQSPICRRLASTASTISVKLPISVETDGTSSTLQVAFIFSSRAFSSGLNCGHGERSYVVHGDDHAGVNMLCVELQPLPSLALDD